jgi:hypothetical protein
MVAPFRFVPGNNRKRVRHLRVQAADPGARVDRIELVDVDGAVVRSAEAEVTSGRAVVLKPDRHVAGPLAYDIDRVLLHVRRLLVLIDELDVAAIAFQHAERVAARLVDAGRERVGQSGGRLELILHHERVLAVAHLAVVGRADGLVIPRCLVDAVAAAHHGLGIHRVDEPDARRELRRRLIALDGRVAVDAGIHQAAARTGRAERAAGIHRCDRSRP